MISHYYKMDKTLLFFLFFTFFNVYNSVPAPEDLKNVIPGHLEFDPEFQQKFPHISSRKGDSRIVGGIESVPNSRPYQVAIFIPVGNAGLRLFCGGTLINARTVLTAAHCVDQLNGSLTIHLGAHNMPPSTTDTRVVTKLSSDVVIHPQWNRNILLNDVAIVRFEISVPLSDSISPVLLPRDNNTDYLGNTTLTSGWGRPSDLLPGSSPVLREVSSFVISNYACRLGFLGTIEQSHICCSGAFGRSSCQGDSGGPLVINGVLIGVVSFGSAWGCSHGWPAVYARVTFYLDWIHANWASIPTMPISDPIINQISYF